MTCDKCGEDRADVLPRFLALDSLRRLGFVRKNPQTGAEFTYDPALCTACCAQVPGREWMRGK